MKKIDEIFFQQPEENSGEQLLHDYLVSISEDDLSLAVKFFDYLKFTHNREIIKDTDRIMKIALDCIYSCKNFDMYEKAKNIFECIPLSQGNTGNSELVYQIIEELEQELESLKVLSKYNVKTTLSYIKDNKKKPDIVKLMLTQMARYVKWVEI